MYTDSVWYTNVYWFFNRECQHIFVLHNLYVKYK